MVIPSEDRIHCRGCNATVSFVKYYFLNKRDLADAGIFTRMIDVDVSEDAQNRKVIGRNTLAHVRCSGCKMLIGSKFIAVPEPTENIKVGHFSMDLNELIDWKGVTLFNSLLGIGGATEQAPAGQDGGANEQNADQDGDANERIPMEQDLGANEQNADQDEDANEQVPMEQDLGANEQNAEQDEDANEQVPNEQDVVANEQNANQDEVGGAQRKRRRTSM
ncbi:hypothetical protein P3L10_017252 [Capsicum annuum]